MDDKYQIMSNGSDYDRGRLYATDCIFFFNHTDPTEIYTLSLHDALPIFSSAEPVRWRIMISFTRSIPNSSLSDRKSTRLNSSHVEISYAVFCLKKKKVILLMKAFISPLT